MRIEITKSYTIDIPENVIEDVDGTVTSYWKKGEDSALQLSSIYLRTGDQIPAQQRMDERLARKENVSPTAFQVETVAPDHAGITFVDEQGTLWLYVYLVWSDLSIFATVFVPHDGINLRDTWQYQSMKSIRRTYN